MSKVLTMKLRTLVRIASLLLCLAFATACDRATTKADKGALPWLTSYPEGVAKAKAENKPMLLEFTGSDWCGWCIKLASEIYAQPRFQEYAKEKLVLVEQDFPHSHPVPTEVLAEREALRDKLNVRGFPTVVVFSPDGTELGRLGYVRGGPEAFIAELEKITKR
jgi:thioredoxin-related protein